MFLLRFKHHPSSSDSSKHSLSGKSSEEPRAQHSLEEKKTTTVTKATVSESSLKDDVDARRLELTRQTALSVETTPTSAVADVRVR